MKMTKHAAERSQQRALPPEVLELVLRHGRVSYASGGTEKLFFGKKECARMISELKKGIKTLERARGGTIILSNENIITVYKQH
ncbi:MAG: hypothetical protein ACI8PB_000056 [Desulforhopalus sp.]|jgi:hypothetical protein